MRSRNVRGRPVPGNGADAPMGEARSRTLEDGLHWIQECGPVRHDLCGSVEGWPQDWFVAGRGVHLPQNLYVVRGEKSLALDTLSPAARGFVVRELDEVLDGAPLDYLVVSHPDVPHAGNTARILRAHPEATLVAPAVGETHALYHLEGALKVGPGDGIDLGGRSVRFHEATFLDHAMHLWMTEERSRTLFPVDWLGFPHMVGECLRCVDELDTEVSVARLVEFHGRVMFWFQYVDAERVCDAIDDVWERHRPERLAPAHGLVVRRDARALFDRMKDVVRYVAERGRTGVA